MTTIQDLGELLNLGFPAVVLIILTVLWAEYRKQVNGRIDDLREMCGMRPSIHMAASQDLSERVKGDEVAP